MRNVPGRPKLSNAPTIPELREGSEAEDARSEGSSDSGGEAASHAVRSEPRDKILH